MQKVILVTLLVIAVSASPDYCGFFKAFGNTFTGPQCSSDLDKSCFSVTDGIEQAKKIIGGDTSALIMLIADLTNAYNMLMSSINSCKYMEHIQKLIENIPNIYNIVTEHFAELMGDAECIIESFALKDLLKLGECIGDVLKILSN